MVVCNMLFYCMFVCLLFIYFCLDQDIAIVHSQKEAIAVSFARG